jgi:hypothetical protein
MLFKDAPPHLQRRSFRQILIALTLGVLAACTVGALLYRQGAVVGLH